MNEFWDNLFCLAMAAFVLSPIPMVIWSELDARRRHEEMMDRIDPHWKEKEKERCHGI